MNFFQDKSRRRIGSALVLLCALLLAGVLGLTPTRPALASVGKSATDTLGPGQSLYAWDTLSSTTGEFTLTMQGSDGNLVLRRASGSSLPGHPLWYTSMFVVAGAGAHVTMGTDGNLRLYDAANHVVWSTNTGGHSGANARLVVQNDGNLVIYTDSGSVLWAAYSNKANTTLYPGDVLNAGWVLESADGVFQLLMRGDGNLVVYSLAGARQAIWQTNTVGCSGCNRLVMQQADGNLVVRDALGLAIWSSGTWGNQGATAVLHSGDIVVYSASKQPLWGGVPIAVKNEIRRWLAHVTESWHESWNGYLEYGTDFGMAPETPLYAVEGGRVLGTGFYGGGGVVSVKAAPGMSEYYQHLDDISVRPGQQLKPGDLVGYSGGQTSGYDHPATCCSGGPHLEWGINAPASWGSPWDSLGPNVNPLPYLKALAR